MLPIQLFVSLIVETAKKQEARDETTLIQQVETDATQTALQSKLAGFASEDLQLPETPAPGALPGFTRMTL